jgi:hypothetical protein
MKGDFPDGGRWVGFGSPCEIACEVLNGEASCVDAAAPIPDCALDGAACWNGNLTTCRGGFPTNTHACGDGTTCVAVTDCGALCVSGSPDPRCDDGVRSLCDDGNLASCVCGYVVHKQDCGGTDLCHEVEGDLFCTLAANADSRCGDATLSLSGYCTSTQAITCHFGFPVVAQTCDGETPVCAVGTRNGASCVGG